MRNAQGLNPDTLHDTATGAIALMTAAQKRLRLIARCLAEGLRDMYLGVRATLCENASEADIAYALETARPFFALCRKRWAELMIATLPARAAGGRAITP